MRTLASGMTFRLPVITCPAEGHKKLEFRQSQESGALESISTVELWSLELARLEHQGSLEIVRRLLQFSYTLNVKIHPRLEQRWLELSNSKRGPQDDFSCKTL